MFDRGVVRQQATNAYVALVQNRLAEPQACVQGAPRQPNREKRIAFGWEQLLALDDLCRGRQFCDHHRHGFKCLNFPVVKGSLVAVLDSEYAHDAPGLNHGHAHQRAKKIFPGLWAVHKGRVRPSIGQ